jgi:hypothetical protein
VDVRIVDYADAEAVVAKVIRYKFMYDDLKRMQQANDWSDEGRFMVMERNLMKLERCLKLSTFRISQEIG